MTSLETNFSRASALLISARVCAVDSKVPRGKSNVDVSPAS